MFKDIFGDSPQTKILDFLADHPDFDYSISEIAKKLADIESQESIKKYTPNLVKIDNRTKIHKTAANS